MNQDNSTLYLDADIHNDHYVCGCLLQPFTLKLYIRLELIGSPLVKGGPVEWEDMATAIAICSHTGKEPMHAIKFKRLGFFKRWGWKLWHLYNYYRRDLDAEYIAFREYINDYCSIPELIERVPDKEEWHDLIDSEEIPDKVNPFPWYLIHQLILVKKTGWTPEYVENMPLSKIIWWCEGLSYLDTGTSRIKSDQYNSVMDIAIKERAERERLERLTPSQ